MHQIKHFSTIAGEMGDILKFISIGTCMPLIIAVIYREWDMVLPMAIVPFIFFMSGSILSPLSADEGEAGFGTALCTVALIWLTCALVCAIPFSLGIGMPYLDAVFEAMSGWTSTGLTLSTSIDTMPHTLLFWRSLMQWLGGLGIVAFTIALAGRSDLTHFRLYRSEGRSEALLPSVVGTGMQMWQIYIILTLLSTGLILLSGVSLWDAVNIALVAISTGGFTVHSEGMLYYDNWVLEMLVIPVMIAGALPFKIYYMMYRKRQMNIFANTQAMLFFFLLAAGFLIVTFDLFSIGHLDILTSVRQGLFMTVSALTCTGLQDAYPQLWPHSTILLLTFLMIIGGASGSTAGGIKLSRVALGISGQIWWFRRIFAGRHASVPFVFEGKVIPKKIAEPEISKNMLIIVLYLLIIIIMTFAALHLQYTSLESANVLFDIVSAMSNVGISTGYVSPHLSASVKLCFILTMWIGRLEIIPVIALIFGIFKRFDW